MPLSSSIRSTRTAFDERGQPYTLFELRTEGGDYAWVAERRYSDFKKLSQTLQEKQRQAGNARAPPEMPKSNASWLGGGSMNPDFIRKRAAGLDAWLQKLLQSHQEDEVLLQFLADTTARRKSLSGIAASAGRAGDGTTPAAGGATAATRTRVIAAAPPPLTWHLVWEAPADEDEQQTEQPSATSYQRST